MASLTTLTVQDLLWIHLQVTGRVQEFHYANLEEGTFYQYAYGESRDLLSQSARFVPGFLKMKPFAEGNEATVFVAVLAFLGLNGKHVDLKDGDALAWFKRASSRETSLAAISSVAHDDPHGHEHHSHNPDIRGAIRRVLDTYPQTVAALVGVKA